MKQTFYKGYVFFTIVGVIVSCVNSQLDFGPSRGNGGGNWRLSTQGFGQHQSGAGGSQGGPQNGGGGQQGQQQGGGGQQGGQQQGGGGQQGGQQQGGGGQQGGYHFVGGGQQGQQQGGGGGQQGGQQQGGGGPPKPHPQIIPQSICVLKADPGFCNLIIGRWYYDARYHRCLPFLYTGCGGNTNNFVSPKTCDETSRTCHTPHTSYIPPVHNMHPVSDLHHHPFNHHPLLFPH